MSASNLLPSMKIRTSTAFSFPVPRQEILFPPPRPRRWLLRWGVVLLNCSHVVWQLRAWEARSDPLSQVRDMCISLLRDVMSERGVQQRPLAATLQELQRIYDTLAHHHQPAARELASILWRLYCSLSQLETAPAPGTLTEKTA